MSLQDEINAKASKIFRESYQMSIGELINLYKDDEMDIHPEFQRVFRWSEYQKTKLIESIILNIQYHRFLSVKMRMESGM